MKVIFSRIKDYRAIGEAEIDWKSGSVGCWTISGEYGSGKTSILRAIKFCLKGKERGESVDECIRIGKDAAEVYCEFEIDNYVLKVKRTRTRGVGESLSVESPTVKLEGDRMTNDIQARLDSLIGEELTTEALEASIIGDQGKIQAFIDASPSDRAKVFASILGCDHFYRMAKSCYALIRRRETEKAVSESNVSELEFRVSAADGLPDELVEMERTLDGLNHRAESLNGDIHVIGEELDSVNQRINEIALVNRDISRKLDAAAKLEADVARLNKDMAYNNAKSLVAGKTLVLASARDRVKICQRERDATDELIRDAEASLRESLAYAEELDRLRRRKDQVESSVETVRKGLSDERWKLVAAAERRAFEHDASILRRKSESDRTYDAQIDGIKERIKSVTWRITNAEKQIVPSLDAIKCDGSGKCDLMVAANDAAAALPDLRKSLVTAEKELDDVIKTKKSSGAELEGMLGKCLIHDGEKTYSLRQYVEKTSLDYENKIKFFGEETEKEIGEIDAEINRLKGLCPLGAVSMRADLLSKKRKLANDDKRLKSAGASLASTLSDLARAEVLVSERDNNIREMKRDINALSAEILELEDSISDSDDFVKIFRALKADLADRHDELNAVRTEATEAEKRIAVIENVISDAEKLRSELAEQKERLELLSDESVKLGKLLVWIRAAPHMIIERMVPSIEETANRYLDRFTSSRYDGPITISFPGPADRVFRKGKQEKFEIVASDSAGKRRVEIMSGCEKEWIAIAIRLATSAISSSRTGARIDIMTLDEPFTGMNFEGVENVKFAISELVSAGKQIMVISHIKDIQEIGDGRISVRRSDDGSKVSVEG